MSDSKITWLLELFNKRIFKFQKIVETRPNTIETNVTDEVVNKLREQTQRDKSSILELQASDRLRKAN